MAATSYLGDEAECAVEEGPMTIRITPKKRKRATRQCALTFGARASVKVIEAVLKGRKKP